MDGKGDWFAVEQVVAKPRQKFNSSNRAIVLSSKYKQLQISFRTAVNADGGKTVTYYARLKTAATD